MAYKASRASYASIEVERVAKCWSKFSSMIVPYSLHKWLGGSPAYSTVYCGEYEAKLAIDSGSYA